MRNEHWTLSHKEHNKTFLRVEIITSFWLHSRKLHQSSGETNFTANHKAPCKRTQHCRPTTPDIVGCYMLRAFAHPIACFCVLLRVVAQSLKLVKLFSQQLPTFLLFRDRRSVAQQVWIRLHSSSNIVGATHDHYTWSPKYYGLYPSHDTLRVPTLLNVVASVCT